MAKGILLHKPGTAYDDVPEERYQFPKRYLTRARAMEGDWIISYEPGRHAGGRVYRAVARIARIEPDPSGPDLFVARIAPGSCLPFERPVPLRDDGLIRETTLCRPDGTLDRGAAQWAVRPLSDLRLINGGGRAEAAHIQPVHRDGPDTVRNGIALSGTVHGMFDRGLIALADDLTILVSRHVNDPGQVWSLVNADRRARAPADRAHHPHPKYLGWHRAEVFKQ